MSGTVAKKAGWHAFFDGSDANPYPAGSTKRQYWATGWKQAQRHCAVLTFADFKRLKESKQDV
jgi:ribosome modulation factor